MYVIILRKTGLVIRVKIVFTVQKNYLIDDLIICWEKNLSSRILIFIFSKGPCCSKPFNKLCDS